MHRLFVAIRPPAGIRDALIDTMEGLDGARWQGDDQLHLTLRYVGEVETPVANDLAAALGRIEAENFALRIEGVGHFARSRGYGKRPHALWAALAPSPPLLRLRDKVERACRSSGLEPETRRFTPHITLARLNRSSDPVAPWLAAHEALRTPPFDAGGFTLFESHLGLGEPIYEPIVRFSLAPPASRG